MKSYYFLLVLLVLSSCNSVNIPDGPNETEIRDFSNITMNSTNDTIAYIEKEPKLLTTIKIASFDLSTLSESKITTNKVSTTMATVLKKYDIIALQEINDDSQTLLDKFVREQMPEYKILASKYNKENKTKEQYAFLYNPSIFSLQSSFLYYDTQEDFVSEPFLAEFIIKQTKSKFVLINMHVDQSDAQQEIKHLQNVLHFARGHFSNDNILILGNLNADCIYYEPGTFLSDYSWFITDDVDTTTTSDNCAYDRILSYSSLPVLKSGVDTYLTKEAGNSQELVEAISEHYPVYIEVQI